MTRDQAGHISMGIICAACVGQATVFTLMVPQGYWTWLIFGPPALVFGLFFILGFFIKLEPEDFQPPGV